MDFTGLKERLEVTTRDWLAKKAPTPLIGIFAQISIKPDGSASIICEEGLDQSLMRVSLQSFLLSIPTKTPYIFNRIQQDFLYHPKPVNFADATMGDFYIIYSRRTLLDVEGFGAKSYKILEEFLQEAGYPSLRKI